MEPQRQCLKAWRGVPNIAGHDVIGLGLGRALKHFVVVWGPRDHSLRLTAPADDESLFVLPHPLQNLAKLRASGQRRNYVCYFLQNSRFLPCALELIN